MEQYGGQIDNGLDMNASSDVRALVRPLMLRVYNWMAIGLTLTAIVSMVVLQTPEVYSFAAQNMMLLFIVQIGFVMGLSFGINKMSAMVAATLFFVYAALNGLTMGVIVAAYTQTSVVATFFITAGMFGTMSFIGYVTKKDLTGVGHFMFMGLIGIIIASVVNIFVGSTALSWGISFIGVFVFLGLTAWDTQKIKKMLFMSYGNSESLMKISAIGALMLYLDFINMFLMLLRFTGGRK